VRVTYAFASIFETFFLNYVFMYFHQNVLLIFQKSVTINLFLDPKQGDDLPLPHAHVWLELYTKLLIDKYDCYLVDQLLVERKSSI